MAGTSTKVYPLRDRFAPGVPHRVHELPSKAAADVLVGTGAFTDNPNDPDRIPDDEIPDAVDEPVTTSEAEGLLAAGEEVPEGVGEPTPEATVKERITPEPAPARRSAETTAADAAKEG